MTQEVQRATNNPTDQQPSTLLDNAMITINLDNDLEAMLNSMADKAQMPPEQLVKNLIKRYAEAITATECDFFDYAGIWQDRDIDQITIRAGAWRDGQQ